MSKGRKDHFVPCGYLRHFATDDSRLTTTKHRKWKVHAYNRIKNVEIATPVSIETVAYSKSFEYFDGDEQLNQEIRKEISQIENDFFPIQAQIVNQNNIRDLTLEEFHKVIDFIAFQRERTEFRRQLYKTRLEFNLESDGDALKLNKHGQALLQKVIPLVKADHFSKIDDLNVTEIEKDILTKAIEGAVIRVDKEIELGHWNTRMASELGKMIGGKQVLQNHHLQKGFDFSKRFAEQLKNCEWVLFTNKTSQSLWTSDNPTVTFLNPSQFKPLPEPFEKIMRGPKTWAGIIETTNPVDENGKANEEFCLLFPLSPYLTLKADMYDLDLGLRYREVEIEDTIDVHKFNFYQLACTSRFIYSNQNNFDKINDMQMQLYKLSQELKELPNKFREGMVDIINKRRT